MESRRNGPQLSSRHDDDDDDDDTGDMSPIPTTCMDRSVEVDFYLYSVDRLLLAESFCQQKNV